MERAHRIGQTKPVKVYRLVCSGSVEERMVSERRGVKEMREHKANAVSKRYSSAVTAPGMSAVARLAVVPTGLVSVRGWDLAWGAESAIST